MKVVAFNGSPRRNGNTELLLRKVLEPIAEAGIETELIQVGGTDVRVDEWGIDVCVTTPNKCLEAVPGIGFISVSPRAWRLSTQ